MRRLLGSLGLLVVLALTLVAVGCGEDKGPTGKGGGASKGNDNVTLTQGSGLTFAMVTHSDEGAFWTVVKKGAQQAAKDEGVKLIWSPSNNDPQKQAQLIDAAVSQKVDGLAVSVPNASAQTNIAPASCCSRLRLMKSAFDRFDRVNGISDIARNDPAKTAPPDGPIAVMMNGPKPWLTISSNFA